MVNTLTQILDTVHYLGLSDGDLLSNYCISRHKRMQNFCHQYNVKIVPKGFQEGINRQAYNDILDHYSRLILSNYYQSKK